jgi:hypothetical protein
MGDEEWSCAGASRSWGICFGSYKGIGVIEQ